MFWFKDWVWQAYLMSDGTWSRDHIQLIWFHFLFGRIVCRIIVICCKNCPKLHCFGTFAGAGAHHQGLRWLKTCQFQRTVYWHCECDKLQPAARFRLPAVCRSWTRCHKANELCLTRLQLANMEVSINDGSDWKTFIALLKPGQRLIKKYQIGWRWVFPAQRKVVFPRMQRSRIPTGWLLAPDCWEKGVSWALDWLFWPNLPLELEAEEFFCNAFVEVKWVSWRKMCLDCLLVGKICTKCFHCFGPDVVFCCNLHSLTFLRKSTALPSSFLCRFNAKQMLLH